MVLLLPTLVHSPAGVVKTVFVALQANSNYSEAQQGLVFASGSKKNVRRLGHHPGNRSGFWEVCPVVVNAIDALTDEASAERQGALATNSNTEGVGVNILYLSAREAEVHGRVEHLSRGLASSLRELYFLGAVLSTEGGDVEAIKALEGEIGKYGG